MGPVRVLESTDSKYSKFGSCVECSKIVRPASSVAVFRPYP